MVLLMWFDTKHNNDRPVLTIISCWLHNEINEYRLRPCPTGLVGETGIHASLVHPVLFFPFADDASCLIWKVMSTAKSFTAV